MNSPDFDLKEDERIIYRTKEHWNILTGPFLILFLGGLSLPAKGLSAVILLALGTLLVIIGAVKLQRSSFVITNQRLLIRSWFFWNRSHDIPLTEIENAAFHMPAMGKLLNFGKVMIITKDRKNPMYRIVGAPMDFVQNLERQVVSLKSKEEPA